MVVTCCETLDEWRGFGRRDALCCQCADLLHYAQLVIRVVAVAIGQPLRRDQTEFLVVSDSLDGCLRPPDQFTYLHSYLLHTA